MNKDEEFKELQRRQADLKGRLIAYGMELLLLIYVLLKSVGVLP